MVTDQLALPAVDIALQHNHPDIFEPDPRMASDLGHYVLSEMQKTGDFGPKQSVVVAALYLFGEMTVDQIVETTQLFPGLELNKMQAKKALQNLGSRDLVTGAYKGARYLTYSLQTEFVGTNEQQALGLIAEFDAIKREIDLDQVLKKFTEIIDSDPSILNKPRYQEILNKMFQNVSGGISSNDFDDSTESKELARMVAKLNLSIGPGTIMVNDKVKIKIFSLSLESLRSVSQTSNALISPDVFLPERFLPTIKFNDIRNQLCAPILAVLDQYRQEGIHPNKIIDDLISLGFDKINVRSFNSALRRLHDLGLVIMTSVLDSQELGNLKHRRIHKTQVVIDPEYDPESYVPLEGTKQQLVVDRKRERERSKSIGRAVIVKQHFLAGQKVLRQKEHSFWIAGTQIKTNFIKPNDSLPSLTFIDTDVVALGVYDSLFAGDTWIDCIDEIRLESGLSGKEIRKRLEEVVSDNGVKLFIFGKDGSVKINPRLKRHKNVTFKSSDSILPLI